MQSMISRRRGSGLLALVVALALATSLSTPAVGDETDTLTVIRGYEGTHGQSIGPVASDTRAGLPGSPPVHP